jgi:hypothetical protein
LVIETIVIKVKDMALFPLFLLIGVPGNIINAAIFYRYG